MSRGYQLRNWAEMNDIARRLDPSSFGRVCQCLLALSFRDAGYQVKHFQFVGRPDFVAEGDSNGFSVEAKSPSGRFVNIKRQDLMGIEGLGHKPIIAVLTYPQLSTEWLVVEASRLSPRVYCKSDLEPLSDPDIGLEISKRFYTVASRYGQEIYEASPDALKQIIVSPIRRNGIAPRPKLPASKQ